MKLRTVQWTYINPPIATPDDSSIRVDILATPGQAPGDRVNEGVVDFFLDKKHIATLSPRDARHLANYFKTAARDAEALQSVVTQHGRKQCARKGSQDDWPEKTQKEKS